MSLRKIAKILLFGIAGMLLFVLTLLLGIKLALDRAPRYQAEIKEWVHRQSGYHIAFAHVSPAFRWYGPELYFDRLELRSKDDQRVLARAAGGRIGADIWQLFRSGKLFAVRIELDSPNIVISRVGPDSFALASEIVLGGQDSEGGTLTLNDMPAGELAIRRGLVTLQNWNSTLPQLEFRSVDVDLSRGADFAALRLNAQMPAVLGGALIFDGTARGRGSIATIDWRFLASARGMSFPGWRDLLPEYLTRLAAGTGGFEVLARGQGATLARADVDFSAQGVVATLTDTPSAAFTQISGALTATHAGDRWTVLGRRMQAQRARHRDPDSEFDVSWRADDTGLLELRASASYLRAEELLPLAGLMPQKDIRERLRDIAPTGEWMDMRLQLMRGQVASPWKLQVNARFRDVGFAPVGRAPGLRGLNGILAGDESGGRLAIESQAAVFSWPGEFPQPLNLTQLKSTLYWRRTAEEFLVATTDLQLGVRNASAHAKAAWRQPSDGSSPLLSLASTVDGGNLTDTHLFLPRELLAPSALAWLDRAFIAGRLSHADAIIQGPVRQFPFRDGSGVFVARCRIQGMTLDYREGWPRIEGLAGEVEFRNQGMNARLSSGRTSGLIVDSGDARFVDFKNGELQIHSTLHGGAADALQFLRATPLDALTDRAFSSVEGKGDLKSSVNLFFPFKQFDQRRVLVHVDLKDASVNRVGSTLAATDLAGEADIDGGQVSHADIRGRVLGGAFQMNARAPRNRAVTRTQLEFRGTFSGDALRGALSLPANVPIGGQADWHGVLKMAPEPTRERSLRITSSLSGLELKLPEPLAKPATRALPSLLEAQWPQSGGVQVRVVLGSLLRSTMIMEGDGNATRLGRAAIAFGSAEPVYSDTQAVNVGGTIETLDLTGWLKLGAPTKGAKPLSSYLHSAELEVGRVDYLGLSFQDVTLDLAEHSGGWRIAVTGPNVQGSIALPADSAQPWDLEFQRLRFVAALPEAGAEADEKGPTDPRSIPAVNFHAAELTWGDRRFGDVRASVSKVDDGVSLEQLTVTSEVYSVSAQGEWRGKDGGSDRIEGTMTSTDVGDTLKQLGFAPVLEAKSGRLEFDMSWMGAPTADSLKSATGHVQVALDKGQIVGLKPGAGRVLGLASLSELRRRLALDFSDLTDKGFAFDTIRGDFDIRDGSAYTDNMLVKGPAAEIGLIGRVGLKNEDYDQTAAVTGSVGNSPLPLAAFVAGPVIGGAVLLFTQVFKQPLKGLVRGYYRISGTWDNPVVERIKGADAASATAEAPK
jgi:uncharacterized protein (TIGR02099 family)